MVINAIGFADQHRDKSKPLASAQSYGIRHSPRRGLWWRAADHSWRPAATPCPSRPGSTEFSGAASRPLRVCCSTITWTPSLSPERPFGLDPSPANKLAPGKRPMTSMVPTVITAGATPSPLVGAFGGSGGLPAISAVVQLITCLRMYALPHCVWNDTRVQPTFRSTTPNAVFAEPKSSHFNPAHLLRRLGYTVTEKTIASAATGIAVLKTGLLLAPNDTKHVDGSRSVSKAAANHSQYSRIADVYHWYTSEKFIQAYRNCRVENWSYETLPLCLKYDTTDILNYTAWKRRYPSCGGSQQSPILVLFAQSEYKYFDPIPVPELRLVPPDRHRDGRHDA
ncbi:hypothetical protein MTO96_023536 [Rhipicephalus appendiculatus]